MIYKYLYFSYLKRVVSHLSSVYTYKCLTFAVFVSGQEEACYGKCFMWYFSSFKTEFEFKCIFLRLVLSFT